MNATPPLEEEHAALLSFLNAAPIGLVQAAADGRIDLINGVAAKLLLPVAGTHALDNLFDVLAPLAPDLRERAAAFTAASGTVCEGLLLECLAVAPGARAARFLSLTLMKVGAGRLMAVLGDVTRQVENERALRQSERQLLFTLDAAQVGDWQLDLASGAMQRSARHDRCFGYAEPPAHWDFERFVQHVFPDDRAGIRAGFAAAVGEARDWLAECRVVWPDGSVHWISIHGHLQFDKGMAARMHGVVIDNTVQRDAEAARALAQHLRAENRQIHAQSQMKSQFLANMSHELRTPLNAVIGFADLLNSGAVAQGSPKHALYVGHIASSGRHLLQLINDVLDLAKVESGKFEFFPERVSLPALLKDVAGVLLADLQRKGIALSTEVDPGVGDLLLDPARLKQVLFNYLSNAIKFTPDGGQVAVRATRDGPAHVRIEVEDSGVGISAGDLSRLFVDFQQLDSGHARQHQGTGLGLALTRRLVEAQGGRVGVRSVPGQGSVFHVVLNCLHGTDALRAERAARQLGEPDQSQLLLIERASPQAAHLGEGLGDAGFQVDVAESAERALSHARSTPFDAIALALQPGAWRGLDVLAGIRAEGASRSSPVVCMTVQGQGVAASGFAIANVLSKPIRSGELIAAMARYRLVEPGRACVMVVDDDPLACELMSAALLDIGIDAVSFSDAAEALRQLPEHRPAALVLDLMMPGMDGFTVLDRLRRDPAWQDLPVFIWTAMTLTDAEYAALAASAQAVIAKGGAQLGMMLEALKRGRDALLALPCPG